MRWDPEVHSKNRERIMRSAQSATPNAIDEFKYSTSSLFSVMLVSVPGNEKKNGTRRGAICAVVSVHGSVFYTRLCMIQCVQYVYMPVDLTVKYDSRNKLISIGSLLDSSGWCFSILASQLLYDCERERELHPQPV